MSNDAERFDPTDHLAAFNAVASALKPMDRDARIRVLQMVVTLYDLPTYLSNGKVIQTYPSSASAPAQSPDGSPFSEDRTQTAKAFLFDKAPKSDVERVACLAYYLTHYLNTPHFKTLDVSKLNTDAAQLKFSNAAYAVENAVKSGLLVPAAKGNKQLSAIGERYVQALPDRDAAKEVLTRARPKRARSRAKNSTGSSEPEGTTEE